MPKNSNKPKRLNLEEKRRLLIHHLIDNGWLSNVTYIDDQSRKSTGQESFELDALIMGKFRNEFHLISPEGNHVLKITNNSAVFWRKSPGWKKLGSFRIGQVELIDGGVRIYEILYITLPKQETL